MKLINKLAYAVTFTAILSFFTSVSSLNAQQKLNLERTGPIEESATLPNTTRDIQKLLRNPGQIHIQGKYGSIKQTWSPKSKDAPLIIHIQDAHCNYEAQSNISKILESIMKQYPNQVNLVAVEGSVGNIDTSPFAEFSDVDIKREVADYFMKKGKITGPEFLSITGTHKFTIYGIENKKLYDENYKAFLDSLPFRNKSGNYYNYMFNILSSLKHYIYGPKLKEFDKSLTDYQHGKIGFMEYTNILKKWAETEKISLANYNNFTILIKAQAFEKKIDFDIVEKERTRLIEKLGRILPKPKLSKLVINSLHFRLGKLSAAQYYSYLKHLAESLDAGKISKTDYPNLFIYIDYVALNEKMDKAKLFEECAQIENLIAKSMFKNNNQSRLFRLSKNLNILRKMFKLELIKDNYLYYKAHKPDFRIENFINFIKVQAPLYGITFSPNLELSKIDENLPIVERFYDIAISRDPVLIDNMLAEMKKKGTKVCVMVTGGFHTRGLTDIFRKRNLAYAVISPRITKKQKHNTYIDVMTNKKTPFEQFLDQLGEK